MESSLLQLVWIVQKRFLSVHSFMLLHAYRIQFVNKLDHQILIALKSVLKQCYLHRGIFFTVLYLFTVLIQFIYCIITVYCITRVRSFLSSIEYTVRYAVVLSCLPHIRYKTGSVLKVEYFKHFHTTFRLFDLFRRRPHRIFASNI